MSRLDAMPARILDALVQLGYIRTRRHPRTGKPEYSFDYEKCVAAAGGHARVPEFLAARADEYLKPQDEEGAR